MWVLVAIFGVFLLLVLPLVIVCIRRKLQNTNAESKPQVSDVTSHEANAHAHPYYVNVEDETDEPYRVPGRSDAGLGVDPASDDSHLYHVDGARLGGDPETATRKGRHCSGLRKNPDQDARNSHEYAGITPDLTPDYEYIELDGERP